MTNFDSCYLQRVLVGRLDLLSDLCEACLCVVLRELVADRAEPDAKLAAACLHPRGQAADVSRGAAGVGGCFHMKRKCPQFPIAVRG